MMTLKKLYELYKTNFLVSTDTRAIKKNSIFFALKGDNFNGNTFAEKALELGALFSIVDDEKYQTNSQIILVEDVLVTLQKLANYHRKQLKFPIIGLTGSNGKTTTKELIYNVLKQKFNTIATQGNLNNHIGVPITLLSMKPNHEMGIVEMGANHQNEIDFLCSICEPDYGYITNFGKAHLEGFGGIEGVIKGKSELYDFLKAYQKTAFVNPSDALQVSKTAEMNRIMFDFENLHLVEVNPFVKISYDGMIIQSQLIGAYNFANIASAISMGNYFGVSKQAIKTAIESYCPQNNRSQILKTNHNKLFMDAYNANPTSMRAALENFANLEEHQKALIIGDMFELGKESAEEHQIVVDLISQLQFDKVFLVGENFFKTTTKYLKFNDYESFEKFISKNLLRKNTILIKGSRGMRLERIVNLL